ncbi:MAG: hypothetical protein RI894_851, partial [Bacteroidota bacterium]
MQRICQSLAEAGYQVVLIGRELPHSKPLKACNYKQKRLRCFFHTGKLFYAEYNIRLFFALLFIKTTVLTAIDLDTILPNFCVSILRRKPLVYDAHEYFSELPEVVTRPAVKWAWEWVAQRTIPHTTAAYTVGHALSQIFTQRYGVPFRTVRNIALSRSALSNSVLSNSPNLLSNTRANFDKKILLYQGVLNLGRGLREMILAMHHLKNAELETAELWLAGEGDLSEELRELVVKEKLSDKVKFLGYILPDDLKKLSQQAFLGI